MSISAVDIPLEAVEGIVFDIQRFSLHDGAGIRTNVFLKGCPLRCAWCANPESQRLQPEPAFSAQRCIDCGLFEEPCAALWSGADRDQLTERAAACPTCALRWIGRRRTAGDVIQEVLRDAPFYGDGGGMTLTGGEPTFQHHMAEALLRLAKAHGLATAMETSGYTRWDILERLLPHLDQILFDVKHLDSTTHRSHTGVDNALILANLRALAARRAPVTVRVPLIPGFNASEESLIAIARLVLELDGLDKNVCLLPYHTLGRAKYASLGRQYPWEGHDWLPEAEVARLAVVVAGHGLTVNIGG
ncbi:MAG TPA: glycyl-radical enzyme activating protein [Roseiflexaceae bacterium]